MGGNCASYTGSRGLCFRCALFVAGKTERDLNLRWFRPHYYGPGNSRPCFRACPKKRATHHQRAVRLYPTPALSRVADHGGRLFTCRTELVDCPNDNPDFRDHLCACHAGGRDVSAATLSPLRRLCSCRPASVASFDFFYFRPRIIFLEIVLPAPRVQCFDGFCGNTGSARRQTVAEFQLTTISSQTCESF